MSRWEHDKPTAHTAYMREWKKTPAGEAYRLRHNAYIKEWRKKNPEKFHATQKRAIEKMRYDTLSHYSNGEPKCACCGEVEILFLQIDHINDDGANHRRQMVKEQGYISGGNNLPYWLKKNNYPPGFQVLCANCNWGKRLAGKCPHQLTKG